MNFELRGLPFADPRVRRRLLDLSSVLSPERPLRSARFEVNNDRPTTNG